MKMPHRPPPFLNFFDLEECQSKVLKYVLRRDEDNSYRHWDILRHLTPPEGLTHEEWWYAIKLKRLSNRKEILLVDANHKKFSFSMLDIILTGLHEIDLQMGGGVTLSQSITNQHTRNAFLVRSLMEEAITSSQLEGASTTRVVAKAMLKSRRKPRNKHERMIYNNYLAMEHVHSIADKKMTVERILELHRIVTDNTLEDPQTAGRFRESGERVVVEDLKTGEVLHNPPPANELAERMMTLCDFANREDAKNFVHPVLKAIILHFWLSYDHPFVDGNGRTARVLFYWAMLNSKYWLFEFISISEYLLKAPSEYARSFLYTETDDNDLNYFILYQLKIIKKSLNSLYKYIEDKTEETRAIEKKLKSAHLFNYRQESLIIHALKHPGVRYTIQEHKNSHHVAYDTARNDLLYLEKKGILLKKKEGNAFVFFASPDLPRLVE